MTTTIALAGNPNVGKSTIFNALTHARQHVGNWPGKTVEKQAGTAIIHDRPITVVDLPGTYSLNAYSSEEIIARDFILNERPSAVVAVVDAANLERTLYLVSQVMELEVPLVLALNMADAARKRGITIDAHQLSVRLGGVPVVETVGTRGAGIDALKDAIAALIDAAQPVQSVPIQYGPELEKEIDALCTRIAADPVLSQQFYTHWLALKLLERDEDLRARLSSGGYAELVATADAAADRIAAQAGDDAETLITDARYRFIAEVLRGVVVRPQAVETRSDRVDRVVTHPIWGVAIFLLLMWILFQFTANVSAPFLDWIDSAISGPITDWTQAILDAVGLGSSWVAGLAIDGVLAGVGGVLVFVPVLLFLYLGIAILEDTGYMARSAFVMDRIMRAVGLHGKSFLPLMVGFGCNVPAIYATRTLEDPDDRRLTAFVTTFMSCGARLPVYVVFGAAFFGDKAGNLIFGLYLLGVTMALVTAFVLKRTVFRHKPPQPFVLELPAYRAPQMHNVLIQVRERTASFLRTATTVILFSSIAIWFMLASPAGKGETFNAVAPQDSLFGAISHRIAPVFRPAGFGSWEASGALITGFVAKEAVISTMSQLYVGEDNPGASETEEAPASTPFVRDVEQLVTSFGEATLLTAQEIVNIVPRTVNVLPGVHLSRADWLSQGNSEDTTALQSALSVHFDAVSGSTARGRLAAVAFNVFVLLYVPCMASVAAMRHEFGMRWVMYQIMYTVSLAWLAAVIAYQGGLLLGLA